MSGFESGKVDNLYHYPSVLQCEEMTLDRGESWSQLVEQIVQLEELIADLREDTEAEVASLSAIRKLNSMLQDKRRRLRAIDVGA
jgi:Mn-containing catalase